MDLRGRKGQGKGEKEKKERNGGDRRACHPEK